MEKEVDGRTWAELNRDVLTVIFWMVGVIDVLNRAGLVCRAWQKVTKYEPAIWRRIEVTGYPGSYNVGSWWEDGYNFVPILMDQTKLAIDRSKGTVEEFWIRKFADDDLLKYLCDSTDVLKSLRLITCDKISAKGLFDTVKAQPILEELQISSKFFGELLGLEGRELPKLIKFKLDDSWNIWSKSLHSRNEEILNEQAFEIATNMHELRYLQLICNGLTNKGLKAILEGCPHLETLDIRDCRNVNIDSYMRARCSGLKTLMLPEDSLDDYEFQSEVADDDFHNDECKVCYNDEFYDYGPGLSW